MNTSAQRKISNLRTTSFAALVMLLIEIGIGMAVNLFGTLPVNHSGESLFVAFGKSVTHGSVLLTIHALLGTIIIISGITAIIRAFTIHQTMPTVLSWIAMFAILVAWLSGSRFVGGPENGSSMSMAVASVVAVLCYALILFTVSATERIIRPNK